MQVGKLTRQRSVVCPGVERQRAVTVAGAASQRVQGWCSRPASCSGLSSCSGLPAPCASSVRSSVPGVGPECGREAGARVREKDFVTSCRHKDLCGRRSSGGEEEAAGKSCQRRIMGELGALPILVIPGHARFSGRREGISVCMRWVLLLLLPLQLGLWRSDMPCFGAGPWRVARETVGQLRRRCTQKRGEWVTQAAFSDSAPPPRYVEKGLRDLFLPTAGILLYHFFFGESSQPPPAALTASHIPLGAKWSQPPKSPTNTLRSSGRVQLARVTAHCCGHPSGLPTVWVVSSRSPG